MNRVIKFRGKHNSEGDWVEGDLIHGVGAYSGKLFILPNKINLAYVRNCDPLNGVMIANESAGQFTGLHDKNGKEIYEGDILGGHPHGTAWVEYNSEWGCFESVSTYFENDEFGEPIEKYYRSLLANDLKDCFDAWEVIGNRFENPEQCE